MACDGVEKSLPNLLSLMWLDFWSLDGCVRYSSLKIIPQCEWHTGIIFRIYLDGGQNNIFIVPGGLWEGGPLGHPLWFCDVWLGLESQLFWKPFGSNKDDRSTIRACATELWHSDMWWRSDRSTNLWWQKTSLASFGLRGFELNEAESEMSLGHCLLEVFLKKALWPPKKRKLANNG